MTSRLQAEEKYLKCLIFHNLKRQAQNQLEHIRKEGALQISVYEAFHPCKRDVEGQSRTDTGSPLPVLSLMTNYAGEGASAGMRPSCRNSSHNAAGIEYDIIWKFSSASETVRGPGIAAVTAG